MMSVSQDFFIDNQKHEALKASIESYFLAKKLSSTCVLNALWITSPLGTLLAVADEKQLCLLEFIDCPDLQRELTLLISRREARVKFSTNDLLESLSQELKSYFAGTLREFKTPSYAQGTPFQQQVWQALKTISYGNTFSYLELAKTIEKPKAFRAVAQANGANPLAIIVPCHRVINNNGGLGGYAGGIARKKWLLQHEKNRQ